MPFVISRVPLNPTERTVAPGGVIVTLRRLQPVVWVRLASWRPDEVPDLRAVAFPAVLDTGNNGTVLVAETIFRAVTGASPATLRGRHSAAVNGIVLRCYGFNLELLRLRRGSPVDHAAAQLQTDRGVFIIPAHLEHRFPRMPVGGVRCLTADRLTFSLNGDRETFSLWRPPGPPAAR
ncbi:MAG: hypothetical protein C0501_27605 [Isosphaera sp.]|nr:hypothetical protein [Isosphaera sp.]